MMSEFEGRKGLGNSDILFYFIFLGITQLCVIGLLFCFLFDRTTSVPNGAWIRAPSSQLLMSKVEEIEDLGLC